MTTIRQATPRDAPAIFALLTPPVSDAYPVSHLASLLSDPMSLTMVNEPAEIDAFAMVHPRRGNMIEWVFMWPRTIGRVLVGELMDATLRAAATRGWFTWNVTESRYMPDSEDLRLFAAIELGFRLQPDEMYGGVTYQADVDRIKSGGRLSVAERIALGR